MYDSSAVRRCSEDEQRCRRRREAGGRWEVTSARRGDGRRLIV